MPELPKGGSSEHESITWPEGASDPVNSPVHYTHGGIETLDYIKAKLTPIAYRGYLEGSVLKYMSRWRHKNGAEDLRKAQFYLDRLIRALHLRPDEDSEA
jgi:hypothetical protein